MAEIRVFCYHPRDFNIENIYCISITNQQHSKLEQLVKDNCNIEGRQALNKLMEKINNSSSHKCIFCNICLANKSFHRTRIRKWKDGRLCIENFPIYICGHDFCAEKANYTKSTLTDMYGKRVISDNYADSNRRKEQEKELRLCVGCKELLHMSSFSRDTWTRYDRKCNRCLSITRCRNRPAKCIRHEMS